MAQVYEHLHCVTPNPNSQISLSNTGYHYPLNNFSLAFQPSKRNLTDMNFVENDCKVTIGGKCIEMIIKDFQKKWDVLRLETILEPKQ